MAKKKSSKSLDQKQSGPPKKQGSRGGGLGKPSGKRKDSGQTQGAGSRGGAGRSRSASGNRSVGRQGPRDENQFDFSDNETPQRGASKFRSGPPPKRETERNTVPRGELQRLQRVLAAAGFGSRRQCEELIMEGRVEVDGKPVTELGIQVDPKRAEIFVDGSPVRTQRHVYFVLNKPPGVVTTNRDPQGRTRVVDLIQERERVFPVGRLDRNSEGLILLTNDGDLAQQLAHPRYGIQKVYRVTVAGKVDSDKLAQMRKGIFIAEGRVAVDGAKILRHRAHSTDLEILLREGKNREIRRILARLGHKVMTLQRIAIGPLRLGELPKGAYRPVTHAELKRIREDIQRQTRRSRDALIFGEREEDESLENQVGGEGRRRDKPLRRRKKSASSRSSSQDRGEGFANRRPQGTTNRNSKPAGGGRRESKPPGGKPGRGKFAKKGVAPVESEFPFELSLEGSRSQGTVIGELGPESQETRPAKPKRAVGQKTPRGGQRTGGSRPKKFGSGRPKRSGTSQSSGAESSSSTRPIRKAGPGRKKKRS